MHSDLKTTSSIQNLTENSYFTFSLRNLVSDFNLDIDDINEKIDNCGQRFSEFLRLKDGENVVFPIFCDNRACFNPDCKEHREYKFRKEHSSQIEFLNKEMKSPKGWIFTGYRKSPLDFTRKAINYYFRKLFKICKVYSVTAFSVHMEFKINVDGSFYLHFHVVSGGFRNLSYVRRLWGRVIRYELAISKDSLARYVSKYASKIPKNLNESNKDVYLSLVYKTHMHKFSTSVVRVVLEAKYKFIGVIDNKELVKWFKRDYSIGKLTILKYDKVCDDKPVLNWYKPFDFSRISKNQQVLF